jgi:hypothetical protein
MITRPEESYQLWCVVVCDLETRKILVNEEEAKAHKGAVAPREKKNVSLVYAPLTLCTCRFTVANALITAQLDRNM